MKYGESSKETNSGPVTPISEEILRTVLFLFDYHNFMVQNKKLLSKPKHTLRVKEMTVEQRKQKCKEKRTHPYWKRKLI